MKNTITPVTTSFIGVANTPRELQFTMTGERTMQELMCEAGLFNSQVFNTLRSSGVVDTKRKYFDIMAKSIEHLRNGQEDEGLCFEMPVLKLEDVRGIYDDLDLLFAGATNGVCVSSGDLMFTATSYGGRREDVSFGILSDSTTYLVYYEDVMYYDNSTDGVITIYMFDDTVITLRAEQLLGLV